MRLKGLKDGQIEVADIVRHGKHVINGKGVLQIVASAVLYWKGEIIGLIGDGLSVVGCNGNGKRYIACMKQ